MNSCERLRSVTALCLVVLLGVLGTGLPSHSHPADERTDDAGVRVLSADGHSHGTQLVEQDHRVPGGGSLQVAVLPAGTFELAPMVAVRVLVRDLDVVRPRERAPPPHSPRAPPHLA